MTENLLTDYMAQRTFYNIHASATVDNPDQRLTSDINNFTSTSLSLLFTVVTSVVDLASFSGILFSIYPPLFVVLVVYAIGGTVLSFVIGKVRGLRCALAATMAVQFPAPYDWHDLYILCASEDVAVSPS